MSYAEDSYGEGPYAGDSLDANVTLGGTLQRTTGTFAVSAVLSVTLAGTLQRTTGVFAVSPALDVALAGTLQRTTGSFAADAVQALTLTADLQRTTGAFTAAVADPAADTVLAADLQRTTGSFVAALVSPPADVDLAGTLQRTLGAFAADALDALDLDGTVQRTTAVIALGSGPHLDLAGTVRRTTGTFALSVPKYVTLAGTIPRTTGVFTVDLPDYAYVDLAGVTPRVTSTITIATDPISDQLDGAGRQREGIGVAVWDPPVDEPVEIQANYDRISCHAYTGHTRGHGPDFPRGLVLDDLQTAERARRRTRIIVSGKDVSFFRGVPTPEPTYSLISPLLYGPGSIAFPQVYAAVEHIGVGALSWLKPGAPVRIQRVGNTGKTTDWRGYLLDPTITGAGLTFGLIGEASGRAALRDRPPRIFRHREDLGYWWKSFITELGLDAGHEVLTGKVVQNIGGQDMMSYASELSAQGWTTDGNQWTCMPGSDHVYRVAQKDTTTIDGTVYFDDAHTVPNLHRDPAEEPNRVWATGISPTGRRIRFATYPVLQQAAAPSFPGFLTQGDTGDGVLALTTRLRLTGYLSLDDQGTTYTGRVTRAVKDLQDDADLPETGNVNSATWDAVFDLTITGHSIAGARIRPAAQRSAVRKFNLTPSGAIIGRNPDWDPHRLVVDTTIDVGPGFTQPQVRNFASTQLSDAAAPNWVGTIAFNTGAYITGEHTPGDPITGPDLADAHGLKPGDNLWAPLFMGGTMLPVVAVEVSGRDVTATVDTRARDSQAAWEVLARNRESRRDPARSWLAAHRSSGIDNDTVSEWDDVGGEVPATDLDGDAWNVFPVVAGQEGTIASIRLHLHDTECEFVVAVFGKRITPRRLLRRVGDPLSKAGTKRWSDEKVLADLDAHHVLLYVAGSADEPCGYFPGTKTTKTKTVPNPAYVEAAYHPSADDNDTGVDDEPPHLEVSITTAEVTGRWEDDASFGYRAFDDASLWVAIWPRKDCTLTGGRIMRNQLESGS